MKYKLTLRKEAEFDIEEQFEFFEEKRVGLGHDFLLCVEEALDKLQKNPLIYRKIYRELRRTSITRFPFRVFYLVQKKYHYHGCASCEERSYVLEKPHITKAT